MSSSSPVLNALTFDVEDWYHCLEPDPTKWEAWEDRVVAAVRRTLAVLERTGTTATFYVLGHVADRHPALVKEIDAAGHEVGCHSQEHRFIYKQSPEEFATDLKRVSATLRQLVDQPVESYRAPYFSVTEKSRWALAILKEQGYRFDSSIFPVYNHRYGIPGAPRQAYELDEGMTEIPIATYRLGGLNIPCGGGFYFRFYPLAFTMALFRRLNARGERVMFYLHPWELDATQPRVPLPAFLKFRHYWGLGRTESKLERLISSMRFASVREVFAA